MTAWWWAQSSANSSLVSSGSKNRVLTGKIRAFGLTDAPFIARKLHLTGCWLRIPCAEEQGILITRTGKLAGKIWELGVRIRDCPESLATVTGSPWQCWPLRASGPSGSRDLGWLVLLVDHWCLRARWRAPLLPSDREIQALAISSSSSEDVGDRGSDPVSTPTTEHFPGEPACLYFVSLEVSDTF